MDAPLSQRRVCQANPGLEAAPDLTAFTRNAHPSPGFGLQSSGVNQTRTRAAVLTQEQLSQYRDDGFLVVAESRLPEDDVTFVGERVDRLYDRWRTLPRQLAPSPSRKVQPPIARLHRVSALDPVLAHSALFEACRSMAAAILGARQVWCRFDGAVYKHPGAGRVEWHQDFAASTMGTPKRSVHFWIPLNEHSGNAGTLLFVPGSHPRLASQTPPGHAPFSPGWAGLRRFWALDCHRSAALGRELLHTYTVDDPQLQPQSQPPDP